LNIENYQFLIESFKTNQSQKSFMYDLIFDWKLFECFRDRFERTTGDLTFWMKSPVKAENFMNSPGRFFHYEPLETSSFSKNLIIHEAAMF